MITFSGRIGSLAPHLRATACAFPDNLQPVRNGFLKLTPNSTNISPYWPGDIPVLSSYTAVGRLSKSRSQSATSSLSAAHQVRYAHTDVAKVPPNPYRKVITRNPFVKNREKRERQRLFDYLIIVGGIGIPTTWGGKAMVRGFIDSFGIARDTAAVGNIEVEIGQIPEGKQKTFAWRGKPLFVRHRTPKEIEDARAVQVPKLRHPEHDDDRVKRPEWLILLGVCTHLGCVPIPYKGDYDHGYYCPCHGSHYDTSGRVRQGPAPTNLEVPPYEFIETGDKLKIYCGRRS